MKLYKLRVKKYDYENYCGFMIVANSIPDAFEKMYEYVCKDKDYIPYYLRCSNIDIEELGEFQPKKNLDHPILMVDYENA